MHSTCPQAIPTDPSLVALLTLNGDTYDVMNNYNGTNVGTSITFVTGYIGEAAQFQDIGYIMLPYIDFYLRDFTIELWFYLTNGTLTRPMPGLFGECQNNTFNQCLHLKLYDDTTGLRFGFYLDDVDISPVVLYTYQWYHAAFVYNYTSRKRWTYLNGISQSVSATFPTASHLYLGQSGNVTIGQTHASDLFIGYIDHVSITHRAKTQDEILDDATLVAYYSFDCGSTYDSSVNLLHAITVNITVTPGKSNEALQLNTSTAYLQTPGLTALGITNQSFSIAFWIKPMQILGTLFHLSTSSNGSGWCSTILGFSTSGYMIAQISGATLMGPMFSLNVWTHVVYTYSVTNGIHLYTNGTMIGSSGGNIQREGPNLPVYLTIGNGLSGLGNCSFGNISSDPFNGVIDELHIYSREISASDICILLA